MASRTAAAVAAGLPRAPAAPLAADEKQRLLARLAADPALAADPSEISDEVALQLFAALQPYSAALPAAPDAPKSVLLFSATNLSERYLQRLTTTAMVGFLFRMAREWEVPAASRRFVPRSVERAQKARGQAAKGPLRAAELQAGLARLQALQAGLQAAEAASAAAEARFAALSSELSLSAGELAALQAGGAPALRAGLEAAQAAFAAAHEARGDALAASFAVADALRRLGADGDDRVSATEATLRRDHPRQYGLLAAAAGGPPRLSGQQEMPPAAAHGIIDEFLRQLFEFNPDAHVRKAYDEFKLAPGPVPGLAGLQPLAADGSGRLPPAALAGPRPALLDAAEAADLAYLLADPERRNTALHLLQLPRLLEVALRFGEAGAAERFRRALAPPLDGDPAAAAAAQVPPRDTLHRFEHYCEANGSTLRAAAAAIYCDRPDFEWAIQPLKTFTGEPEAVARQVEEYRAVNAGAMNYSVYNVGYGSWSVLASVHANRSRVDLRGPQAALLEQIMDSVRHGNELGRELMAHRVRRNKAKEVREAGPDAPELAGYADLYSEGLLRAGARQAVADRLRARIARAQGDPVKLKQLEELERAGAELDGLLETAGRRPLTVPEREALQRAGRRAKVAEDLLDVPEGAIRVETYHYDAAGGGFTAGHFFTEAEAPDPAVTRQLTLGQAPSAAAAAAAAD